MVGGAQSRPRVRYDPSDEVRPPVALSLQFGPLSPLVVFARASQVVDLGMAPRRNGAIAVVSTHEMRRLWHDPEHPVLLRRARSTRTLVGLYYWPLVDDENPWSTVCEDHGGTVCHRNRALAMGWLSHPEDWCPTCMGDETEART